MTIRIEKYEDLAEKYRAIGHPVRVAILNLLGTCGCSKLAVKDIYNKPQLDQPRTSRYLSIMRKAGILERTKEGGNTYYCLCGHNIHVQCLKKCFERYLLK